MNDHPDVCSHCMANLDGGDIYETFLHRHDGDADKALASASLYGWPPEEPRHWSRVIGIYDNILDRTVEYKCPDCGERWQR